MNREIKFRAKYGKKWVYGNCMEQDKKNNTYLIAMRDAGFFPQHWVEVDGDTIGQYTGLKDKNGKEIYEGDILEMHITGVNFHCKVYVSWGECGFDFRDITHGVEMDFDLSDCKYAEVIGNIHDNPELLKEEYEKIQI